MTFFGVAHDATLGGVEQHGLLEVEDGVVIILAENAHEIAVVLGGHWTFSPPVLRNGIAPRCNARD